MVLFLCSSDPRSVDPSRMFLWCPLMLFKLTASVFSFLELKEITRKKKRKYERKGRPALGPGLMQMQNVPLTVA